MLKSYRERADAFETYASGAKAWMAPEVGGGFWMTPYPGEKVDPMNKGQFMLSVQQKFTNPAKLNANQKYIASQSGIEQANEKIYFNDLRAEARLNYAQRVALEKKRKTLLESEENVQLALKIARLRYSLNREKLGTIYKTEARLGEIQTQQVMNETQIQQKTIALNRLMNLPHTHTFSVDTSLVILSNPIEEETDFNQSVVQKFDKLIESFKLNQQTELAQAKPDFSLNYSHMIPLGAMANQFMLQGMVSIPIAPWSAKSYQAKSKGIEKEIQSMQHEKESVMSELQQEISNTVVEINSIQKQLGSYEQQILPMLKKNYDVTFQAYEENKEELSDVINAWEVLLTSQLQYIDLKLKLHENQINYEKLHDK
jgi:outer membrane protein TolC